MTTTRPARRALKFASLDDAVRDAEGLLAKGYDKAGNWDLAQCCGHLANWLTYPVAGFPKMPAPVRAVFWVLRNTLGRAMYTKYMAEGMPAGKPTITESVPAPGGDDAAAVADLRAAASHRCSASKSGATTSTPRVGCSAARSSSWSMTTSRAPRRRRRSMPS